MNDIIQKVNIIVPFKTTCIMHNQLYMLSHQIHSYKTSHHIKNEMHSVTLILYEGIQYHNVKVTLHKVPKYVLSLHYIRLEPSKYNNCLTSEMG